jgi:transcriptional regulator with XRE-family HTH domain
LFVTNLRKAKGLTPNELAERLDVDVVEILAMERSESYRPSPLALHKLGEFYGIPTRHLAALAGAVREIPSDLEASASRFAAQSESFAGLTSQERKLLDEFVKCLKQG